MKVIYKKTIFEKVVDALNDAERLGKQIDYIEVTPTEMEALYRDVLPKVAFCIKTRTFKTYVCGVEIRVAFQ